MKTSSRRAVLIVSILLIIATLGAVPFARTPFGRDGVLILWLGVAFAVSEALTAVLLLWRTRHTRDISLGFLAGAYAMSAALFVANMLVLAGALGRAGHASAAPWLSLGWHVAWCAMAVGFALVPARATRHALVPAGVGFVVAALYCAVVVFAPLPVLIDHDVTTPLGYAALTLMFACCVAATIVLFRAADRTLALWVGLAALVLALHSFLNIVAETRFALGYYLARVLVGINGAIVLGALAALFSRAIRQADVTQQTERRLRMLLEKLPELVWTAHPDGSPDWLNSRWTEYAGKPPGELVSQWLDLYHPDDAARVQRLMRRSLDTGEPFEAECRLRRSDGVFQWFLARMVAERSDDGDIVRWLGSLTNIDAQKREQQRSSRIARILQEAFLPDLLPVVPGATLDALYEPAESEALIGGDWYDVVHLDVDRLLITCGDVTGHGLEAAILASRYRHTLSFAAMGDPDPAATLKRVNHAAVTQRDAITTAVVAIIDLPSRTMRYATAGHPPPLIASCGRDQFLNGGGLPLGVLLDAAYETHTVDLRDESIVVFYTDGLLEHDRDPLAALETLREAAGDILRDPPSRSPASTIKQRVLRNARPRDDVAILVLQVNASQDGSRRPLHPLSKTWRFHSYDGSSARDARRSVTAFLRERTDVREALYEAELIIGEALANTVQHAPGLVEVTVDWSGEAARLIVCDSGPGIDGPLQIALPDPMSEGGRGLCIIAALAPDLDVRPMGGTGFELRCTLPIRRKIGTPPVTM